MSDLISRQAAIDALCSVDEYNARSVKAIRELPSAEPRKGKWIDTGSGQECSECHEIQYGYDNFRYFCAFCGADMRGEEDE